MNEDKSNKRKDPPTKDTTNTNKKKIDKYFGFQTGSDNNKYYAFESKSDADDFLADFGAVVTKKDTFHLKAEFLAHKKQLDKIALKNTPTTPKLTPTKKKEQLSPEDAASVEKAVRRIIDLRPKNKIVLHWKTTKTSHACLVLVRFKDKQGKEAWNCKAKTILDIMPQYLHQFVDKHALFQDDMVKYAFNNFTTSVMRDLDKAPNEAAGRTVSRNGTKSFFEDYILHTHIMLPVPELSDEKEEQASIVNFCNRLGEALKYVLPGAQFQSILQGCVSPSFWNILTNPKNGPSMVDYLDDCTINVERLGNLNTHIVLPAANELITFLLDK